MAFSRVMIRGGKQLGNNCIRANAYRNCLFPLLSISNQNIHQYSQTRTDLNVCNFHTSSYVCGNREFRLADIGEGIAEVEMLKWHKTLGERIEEMEAICDVQSDKAAVEITSRFSGPIVELRHKIGDMIKIGETLCVINADNEEGDEVIPSTSSSSSSSSSSPSHSVPSQNATARSPTSDKVQVVAVPVARRLARELGININDVPGSGSHGRITKEDVEAFHKNGAKAASSSLPATPKPPSIPVSPSTPKPAFTVPARPQRENQVVQLRGFSRAMVKSMTETAKVPHLNIGEEFDVTDLIRVREKMKAVTEKEYNTKITITSFLIKAVSLTLYKYPILNSKLDNDAQYTIYGSHNISIAMDTPNGLVVPNIKNVQNLNILEIQSELMRLQNLAQSNKLSSSDLTGGTTCISNVGVISGTYVKALLFDNQAMILGIGKTRVLPRYDSKMQLVPRKIMNISISADHRHCDGATVAKYAAELRRMLDNPDLMMMHMS